MALSERIKQPVENHPGKPCSICVLIDTLEGDERAALLAMLGTPEKHGWAAGDIYDAVTAEGYTVGFQTINRHRSGRKPACRARFA